MEWQDMKGLVSSHMAGRCPFLRRSALDALFALEALEQAAPTQQGLLDQLLHAQRLPRGVYVGITLLWGISMVQADLVIYARTDSSSRIALPISLFRSLWRSSKEFLMPCKWVICLQVCGYTAIFSMAYHTYAIPAVHSM